MKRALSRLATFFLIATAIGCPGGGGGGGGSPTEPTFLQLAATYSGFVAYRDSRPEEHCFSQWLSSQGGSHAFSVRVEIDSQAGGAVSGRIVGLQIPIECGFEGQLTAGNRFSWTLTECPRPCATFASEPTCPALRLCKVMDTFDGSVVDGGIEGEHEIAWEAFDVASGEERDRVDVSGDLDLEPGG